MIHTKPNTVPEFIIEINLLNKGKGVEVSDTTKAEYGFYSLEKYFS